jgi:hypothetical protein
LRVLELVWFVDMNVFFLAIGSVITVTEAGEAFSYREAGGDMTR